MFGFADKTAVGYSLDSYGRHIHVCETTWPGLTPLLKSSVRALGTAEIASIWFKSIPALSFNQSCGRGQVCIPA